MTPTAADIYTEAFDQGLRPDPLLTVSEWANQRAVAQEFVYLDRSFHELTGNLRMAVRARNQGSIDRYVGEMIAACGGCHSKYATDRFPGFQRN